MSGLLAALSGAYLAWGIGANDCANVFGPHAGSNLMSYRWIVGIFALFVVLGAFGSGGSMVHDAGRVLPSFAPGDELGWTPVQLAVLVTLSAGVTMNVATAMGLPTSASQGSIGAFFGLALIVGFHRGDLVGIPPWYVFTRMAVGWVISPFLAVALGYAFQRVGGSLLRPILQGTVLFDRTIRVLLLLSGVYGAYVLGASHAGIPMAPFYRAGVFASWGGIPAASWAAGLGGIAIALGAATFAHRVLYRVGKQITSLDPFSAFTAIAAMAVCVHLFKDLGIPISSSQTVVGVVTGVGLTRGSRAVSFVTLRRIAVGWLVTPIIPALATTGGYELATRLF